MGREFQKVNLVSLPFTGLVQALCGPCTSFVSALYQLCISLVPALYCPCSVRVWLVFGIEKV